MKLYAAAARGIGMMLNAPIAAKKIARLITDTRKARPMDWQPIGTAPKDGTPILLWGVADFHPYVGGWYNGDPGEWQDYSTGNTERPKLWHPLPASPAVE